MSRERIDRSRTIADYPKRLKRLQKESGLPWAEIARRFGTYPYTVWHWYEGGVRSHFRHQIALLEFADDLGLAHLLTECRVG